RVSEGGIGEPDIFFNQQFRIFTPVPNSITHARIAEHRQRYVINLNVSCASRSKVSDLRAINIGQVLKEQRFVRIGTAVDAGAAKPKMHGRWRWHCEFWRLFRYRF